MTKNKFIILIILLLLFFVFAGFGYANKASYYDQGQHHIFLCTSNFESETTNKIEQSDFQVKNGKLIGLTERGKNSPTLTIPKTITTLTRSAFNDCSSQLERIIFENFDLWFDPNIINNGCIVGVSPTVQYYTTSYRTYHNLLSLKIDQKKLHMIEVTDDANFFVLSEDNDVLNLKSKQYQLVGLTTKCQNNTTITQLFTPLNITKIASNAFNRCPATINTLTFNTFSEIKEFGKDAFKGANSVTYFFTNNEQSAINLINSGFNRKITVKLTKFVDKKIIVIVFNEYQKNNFIVREEKNNFSLVKLTNIGREVKNNLIIPKEITFIGVQSLLGCQAKVLDFTQIINSNQLTIEKSAFANCKSVDNYLVRDNQMKQKLIIAGVTDGKISCLTTLIWRIFSYVAVFSAVVFSFTITIIWWSFRRKNKKIRLQKS